MRTVQVVLRLIVGFGGGYAAASGFAALASVMLATTAHSARGEVVVLNSMLAFPAYLVLLIWVLAEPWPCRRCLLVVGAGICCWLGTWKLTDQAVGI